MKLYFPDIRTEAGINEYDNHPRMLLVINEIKKTLCGNINLGKKGKPMPCGYLKRAKNLKGEKLHYCHGQGINKIFTDPIYQFHYWPEEISDCIVLLARRIMTESRYLDDQEAAKLVKTSEEIRKKYSQTERIIELDLLQYAQVAHELKLGVFGR